MDNKPQPYSFSKLLAENSSADGKSKVFGQDDRDANFISRGYNHDEIDHMRYLSHSSYSELGYNPFRDNDAVYNEYGSALGDFTRASVMGGRLMAKGFTDSLPWNSFLSTGPDEASSSEYDKLSRMGSSTRGGVAGFASNLTLNAGYTVGILAEMAAEELILAGATLLSGGTATGLTVPAAAASVARGTTKIASAWKTFGKVGKAISQMDNLNGARNIVNGIGKYGTKALEMGADLLTPNLMKGIKEIQQAKRVGKATGEVLEVGKVMSKLTGSLYRDAKAFSLAMSESAMEGGFTLTEARKKLIEDKEQLLGRKLTSEERQAVEKDAMKLAQDTYNWNLPAIYFSNSILFGKILQTSKLEKLAQRSINVRGADIIRTPKKFLLAPKNLYQGVKGSIKNVAESGFKEGALKPLGRATAGFIGANVTEGLQESYQEAIQQWQDYKADKFYSSKEAGGYFSGLGKALYENSPLTSKGFETFLTGMLISGPVQAVTGPVRAGIDFVSDMSGASKDKLSYREFKKQRKESQQKIVDELNAQLKTGQGIQDIFNTVSENSVRSAVASNQLSSTKDKKDDVDQRSEAKAFSFTHHASQGTLGEVIGSLEDIQNMNAEEYAAFMGKEVSDLEGVNYQQKAQEAIDFAKQVQSNYDSVTKLFPQGTNPALLKGKAKERALNYELGRRELIEAFTVNKALYEDNLKRVTELTGSMSKLLPSLTSKDLATVVSRENLRFEQAILQDKIKNIEKLDLEEVSSNEVERFKKELSELQELEESLYGNQDLTSVDINYKKGSTEFNTAKDKFKNYIQSRSKAEISDEKLDEMFDLYMDAINVGIEGQSRNTLIAEIVNKSKRENYEEELASYGEYVNQKRKESLEKAFAAWQANEEQNDMMDRLRAIDVFLTPKDLERIRNGVFPSSMYSIIDNKVGDEIIYTHSKFKAAREAILDFNPNLTGIPLSPITGLALSSMADSQGREVSRRPMTLKKLEEYFKDVSNFKDAVILSLQSDDLIADPRERELLEQLLENIGDDTSIVFDNTQEKPLSYDAKSKTVTIDLRYSASDYAIGSANWGIGHIVSRAAITSFIDNSLESDNTDAVKELIASFEEIQKESELLQDLTPQEFLIEAMTNDRLQGRLAGIRSKTEVAPKSLWLKFIEAVVKYLDIKEFSGSLLNRAIDNFSKFTNNLNSLSAASPVSTEQETETSATSTVNLNEVEAASPSSEEVPVESEGEVDMAEELLRMQGKTPPSASTQTETKSDKNITEKRKKVLLKKANLEKAPEFAKKGIVKTVEAVDEDVRLQVIERAYEGVTADSIAAELGLTTKQVRSIRTYYGVPDISDKIDYENWKKGIDSELQALEQPTSSTQSQIDAKKAEVKRNKELAFVNSLPVDTIISISELNRLGIINTSLFNQSLYNAITSLASKLNIQVRFTNGIKELNSKAGANFDTNTGVANINLNGLYESYQNQLQGKGRANGTLLGTKSLESFEQFVQTIITHELIHSVTQNAYDNLAIDIAKKEIGKSINSLAEFKTQLGGLASKIDAESIYNEVVNNGYSNTLNLNQTQIDALFSIGKIFNYLNTLDSNTYFGGKEYGLVNMSELMAELSNEGFVSALQRIELPENLRYSSINKNIFESIIAFVSDLFKGKKVANNAADSLFASMSDLLTSPQSYNFTEGTFTNNSTTTVQDKINAKYNAELEALEQQSTTTQSTESTQTSPTSQPVEVEDLVFDSMESDAKTFKLNSDVTSYDTEDSAVKLQRQSSYTKGDKQDKNVNMAAGAVIGNFIDAIGRDILSGEAIGSYESYVKEVEERQAQDNSREEYPIEIKAFPEISKTDFQEIVGIMQNIKRFFDEKNMQVMSKDMLAIGIFKQSKEGYDGVAGMLDVLVKDENGDYHIFDFKGKKTKNNTADLERFDTITGWSDQQTVYKELIERKYGVKIASINIIGISLPYTLENGTEVKRTEGEYIKLLTELDEGVNASSKFPFAVNLPISQTMVDKLNNDLVEDQTTAVQSLVQSKLKGKEIGEDKVTRTTKKQVEKQRREVERERVEKEIRDRGEDISVVLNSLKDQTAFKKTVKYKNNFYTISRIVNGEKTKYVTLEDEQGNKRTVSGLEIMEIEVETNPEEFIAQTVDTLKETVEAAKTIKSLSESYQDSSEVKNYLENIFTKNTCE